MNSVLNQLSGRKTYLFGSLFIALGLIGLMSGWDNETAVNRIFEGVLAMTLRAGIQKRT